MSLFKGYADNISDFVRQFAYPVNFNFSDSINDETEIPIYEDLTLLSSQDLGAYASFLRAFSVYYNQLYIECFAAKKFFESEHARLFGALSFQYAHENPKASATAVKQAAFASAEYLSVQNQLTGAEIQLEAMNRNIDSLKDIIATVSRELSRRIANNDRKSDEAY
jgi:hypothetical protein